MNRSIVFLSVVWMAGCAFALPKNPKISVLGDSYSTFAGAIPRGNAVWYPCQPPLSNDVRKVEQCWWSQVIARLSGTLERNESWSGSTVCNTGYKGADVCHNSFVARVMRLGDPDVILVCGGTNDDWAKVPLGAFKYGAWTLADLKAYRPALAKLLHDLKELYPNAKVLFVLNDWIRGGDYGKSTHSICVHYGVPCLDLKNVAKINSHPSVAGMRSMAEQVVAALAESSVKRRGGQ